MLPLVLALLAAAPAPALADAAVPAPPRSLVAACAPRLQRALGDAFPDGRVVVMDAADPPEVQFVAKGLVAAVTAADGAPARGWERDDEWNYPIDRAIVWRERRSLPDGQGAVIVYRGAARWARFLPLARRAVDDCLDHLTRWTPPAGRLAWSSGGTTFTVDLDGSAAFGRTSDGGAAGEMATTAGREVARVLAVLRENRVCELGAPGRGGGATLAVDAAGLRCRVTLPSVTWRDDPRAAACRAAVESLRRRLFPRSLGSPIDL